MRDFLILLVLLAPVCSSVVAQPNVVVVMSDDQGYGDFGYMGNPVIRTPSLDSLAEQSVRMETFYVCPVCAPTRASLLTGRWHMRTRAIDTYVGRAMMDTDEVTVAELLRDAGYATGIFGKWHLGDCPPMRPQDQGFEETLVHRGGGIGQSSDPVGGERKYTDAVLFANGRRVETTGYCTDVYFTAALDFIDRSRARGRPFFCYIPTNAPHGPFHDVPPQLLQAYKQMDLDPVLPKGLRGGRRDKERDKVARVYAMISNVDENVGRLLAHLERRDIADETLVIFLTDNGANGARFNAGLRGSKGEVYEGGIRTPLLARWPGQLTPGTVARTPGAHIDLLPTLAEACGVRLPEGMRIDGRSLLGSWRRDAGMPERTFVVQCHRGDQPIAGRHAAIRQGRWKLVRPSGFAGEGPGKDIPWELYDLAADPSEQRDVIALHPDVARRMREAYAAWFRDVTTTRPLDAGPPLIRVGTSHEPNVVLTRQDWRRLSGGASGVWHLDVAAAMRFRIKVRLARAAVRDGEVRLRFGGVTHTRPVSKGAREVVFYEVGAHQGRTELEATLVTGARGSGAFQVTVSR